MKSFQFNIQGCADGWQIYEQKEEPQPAKEPIANCENCKHVCTNSNIDHCHMYEPQPAYAVGDWVEYRSSFDGRLIQDLIVQVDTDGFVTKDLEEFGCFTFDDKFHYDAPPPCQCEYFTITRKLDPSEVIVHIGCLSGTVMPNGSPYKETDAVFFLVNDDCDESCCIPFAMLDEPTLSLVKDLLEKQKGDAR